MLVGVTYHYVNARVMRFRMDGSAKEKCVCVCVCVWGCL